MCVHPQAAKVQERRSFISQGSLFLLGAGLGLAHASPLLAADAQPKVRLGLITDPHYADKVPTGTRYYRESLNKLEEAATAYQRAKPDFIVELGDFIDSADSVNVEKKYLKQIHRAFTALPGKKHYVLGNHCVQTLTKEEFLAGVEQEKSYYSFDQGGFHFVVLDACFRGDGKPYGRQNFKWTDANIPEEQVKWLEADLRQATGKTCIFAHQRLDVNNHYAASNAAQVRKVLEDSGKVLAVFQGHTHQNSLKEINGIHYCVLRAMIEGSGAENSGYSTVDIMANGTIKLSGFRQQRDYRWPV